MKLDFADAHRYPARHMNSTISFYKDMPTFSGNENLVDDENYFSLPDDWSIVITDVKGSTKAIEQGRYKDVNIVGVGSIISTQNACGTAEIPFIFGGDGATLFIPNDKIAAVKESLAFSRQLAFKDFNLDLRVAIIPMKVILENNKSISIAKLNLSGESCIAMAKGDGLAFAEFLTKKTDQYLIGDLPLAVGTHQGLECRWNPIQSQNGSMMSLIIKAEPHTSDVVLLYKQIIMRLKEIVPHFQLITPNKLSTAWPPVHLYKEMKMKYKKPLRGVIYCGVVGLVFLLTVIVRLTKKNPRSAVSKYLSELASNTDHLKFDEVLRMVIDVSPQQGEEIKKYLTELEAQKQIKFGMHSSKEALMTCYIKSAQNHVHFVDGGSGGYAMAAKAMKEKL